MHIINSKRELLFQPLSVQVAAGISSVCVLVELAYVKCWGRNTYGSLGTANNDASNQGDNIDETCSIPSVNLGNNFIPKKIYPGGRNNCVLSTTLQIFENQNDHF